LAGREPVRETSGYVFLPEERSNHIKEALVKGVPVGLAVQKKHEV
jgi:hypothetical protein